MMLTTSKEANPNYLCKVVKLEGLQKHPNADRLQTVTIDFQTVITGLDAKDGDVYVYFPVECKINKDFLSQTNSFRDKSLNTDPEKVGFFEEKCRVKAMKLRGEKSMGYIVPLASVMIWALGDTKAREEFYDLGRFYNNYFDTINGVKLVEKYQVAVKAGSISNNGKQPKISRLIDGQVHLHVDTENLRRNAHKISPDDVISITYKTHGTSWWVGNVLAKKRLTWFSRIAKSLGVEVVESEYDLIYGSRKVVKNKSLEDPKQKDHYFGYDLWEDIKNEIGDKIPKGFTLYGEYLGYDRNGSMIQKGFDYGCSPEVRSPNHKIEVYRITNTTPDGLVTELTYPEIKEFCDRVGLEAAHLMFYGTAMDWLYQQTGSYSDNEDFGKNFVTELEKEYNEKDCFMCVNKVPEEGIVVRKESLFSCDSYKLKSFRFLEFESKELDKGIIDVESEN